jgi:Zn-dependent protease
VIPSWRIAKVFGIAVYVHWSFWLLILYVLLSEMRTGEFRDGLRSVVFLLVVFGCVFLHELGHAMMALQFGVKTRDITLLPIGGLARLERMPKEPRAEFLIAVAGPAVNVVIAAIIFLVVVASGLVNSLTGTSPFKLDFLSQLLVVNLGLVIFNMIPAFPMDGGRVLRSFLARRRPYLQATQTAVRIGRYFSFAMIVLGIIYGQFGLVLIGGFMLFAGFAELVQVHTTEMMERNPGSPFPFEPLNPDDRANTIDAEDFRRLD